MKQISLNCTSRAASESLNLVAETANIKSDRIQCFLRVAQSFKISMRLDGG
jgi:hypothetical protein